MSLRYQINIRIFFLSLCARLLGGSITIWQARNAVNKEVNSLVQLAVKLISLDGIMAIESQAQQDMGILASIPLS
jgi:hypothetical protein